MKFTFRHQCYELSFWKKIIPYRLRPFIKKFTSVYSGKGAFEALESTKLKDKVVLVTGGYRGIGLSITQIFLREGAKVIITGRNESKLRESCIQLGNVHYMVWDIADTVSCEDNFQKACSLFGRIDILVNNAGVTTEGGGRLSFENITDKHFRYVNGINVIGTTVLCKQFAKINSDGIILNVISNTATYAAKDAYSMSKWALYSFTKSYGQKCFNEGKNIKVNGLCPGPVKTSMTVSENSSLLRGDIPNKRIGLPEEIAELALMIVYSSMYGMNGHIVVCDGGETLM